MKFAFVLSVTLAAAPASAQSLFVGSPDTAFGLASPPTATVNLLGACGAPVAGIAAEGEEMFLAGTFEVVYQFRTTSQSLFPWATAANEEFTGIALRGHELIVATQDGEVVVFDRARGVEMRRFTLPIPATTLVADRGEVFAGTSFGAVMRLASDDTVTFLGSCGATIRGIAGSATELFLASDGGFLWRVDRSTGFVTSSLPLPFDPTSVAHDAGQLFVGDAVGNLYTYEATTGALLGTRNFGHSISAVTLGPAAAGTSYCFGEWSACPCGFGDPFAGCPSWIGVGARLLTYGTASVAADDLELAVLDLPPTTLGRFYMGASQVQTPFGNGLLCAGAGGYGQFRFPAQAAQSSGFLGAFRFGPGIVSHSAQHFGAIGTIQPGSTWHFQAWYRDVLGTCGGLFNTSNAVSVTFQP